MNLSKSEHLLFILLKSSLNGELQLPLPDKLNSSVWEECFSLAKLQGVSAIAWQGITNLSPSTLPHSLKIRWALAVEKYEKKYRHYCEVVAELSNLFASNGIKMVQLKGVGYSSYYPNPCCREGGDIDIYTYSANLQKMSNKEANMLADKIIADLGIKVNFDNGKHSIFTYKGISIENHHYFVNIESYRSAPAVNKFLEENLSPQSVELLGGEYKVVIPSDKFNALFIAYHAAQHYTSGLSLHHLYDWAVLLNSKGWILTNTITDSGFLKFVHSLTQLSNRYLGTQTAMDADSDFTEELLESILHPKFSNPPDNPFAIFVYKAKRFIYSNRKKRKILKFSLFGHICSSVIAHLRNPKTIFSI